MALYELLLIILLITLQRTTCQFPSQQGDEDSPSRSPYDYPFPRPGAAGGFPVPGGEGYPGPDGAYPQPGGAYQGPRGAYGPGGYPGGARGGGGGGMFPPTGPGGFQGSMGRGPGSPPLGPGEGQGPGSSFQEELGEDGVMRPSFYTENLPLPNMGIGEDPQGWSQQPLDSIAIGQASAGSLGQELPSDLELGDGAGTSINEGTHQEFREHSDATKTDGSGLNTGTNPDLTVGENESVKNQGIRQNVTVAGTPDDDFNYVAMYITVAVCITFMVTLVAIALIRGPQGPFKTKRTDEEISRGLAGGPTAEDVIVLSDGATTRTDAQWEQQPLRGDCDGVITDVQDTAGSTTVAVTEVSSKGESV